MHYSICVLAWQWDTFCSLHYPEAKHQTQLQYPTLMNYVPWGWNTIHMAPMGFCYNSALSLTAPVPDLLECLIANWMVSTINKTTLTHVVPTEWCNPHLGQSETNQINTAMQTHLQPNNVILKCQSVAMRLPSITENLIRGVRDIIRDNETDK